MAITTRAFQVGRSTMSLYLTMGIVLVTLNVLLVQQNRNLKAQASRMNRSLELKPGTEVPSIEGTDLRGEKLAFDYKTDSRKTLLLVFSPSCSACKENMANWEAVTRGIDQTAFRVVAISLLPEDTEEYVARYDLGGVPVIADINPKTRVAYNFVVTPQTSLVGADGRVEKVWTGLIRGEERQEVERTLGVRLPEQK